MWVNLREREERHEAVSFEEMLAPFDLFLLGPGRSGDPDEVLDCPFPLGPEFNQLTDSQK